MPPNTRIPWRIALPILTLAAVACVCTAALPGSLTGEGGSGDTGIAPSAEPASGTWQGAGRVETQ